MCWGKVCYLSHRMTKENLFNRNIFCQKVGIKWELLRWYTWLQHKSSDNAFLAISNNLAKCTLALPCITQIHRHFIFLLELATWTDGSTKGWCSSFCVSWLGMLVFQSHVGRGENRSLNRSLQAATTHATTPFLVWIWGIFGWYGFRKQEPWAILSNCSWPVGQICLPNSTSLLMVHKLQDAKALACLEIFSKIFVISLSIKVVFYSFIWKHMEEKWKAKFFYIGPQPLSRSSLNFPYSPTQKEKLDKRKPQNSFLCLFVIPRNSCSVGICCYSLPNTSHAWSVKKNVLIYGIYLPKILRRNHMENA